MLDKARSHGIIHHWVDMQQYVKQTKLSRARDIPYFEGDYWPGIIEEKIKEINSEDGETNSGKGGKKGGGGGEESKKSKGSKKSGGKSKKGKQVLAQGKEDLADRCFEVLEKHKDVFFVAYLNSQEQINKRIKKGKLVQEVDPDILIDFMDGRDGFLCMCRDDHREFSSVRRAKHSSLVLLHHLHNNDSESF